MFAQRFGLRNAGGGWIGWGMMITSASSLWALGQMHSVRADWINFAISRPFNLIKKEVWRIAESLFTMATPFPFDACQQWLKPLVDGLQDMWAPLILCHTVGQDPSLIASSLLRKFKFPNTRKAHGDVLMILWFIKVSHSPWIWFLTNSKSSWVKKKIGQSIGWGNRERPWDWRIPSHSRANRDGRLNTVVLLVVYIGITDLGNDCLPLFMPSFGVV